MTRNHQLKLFTIGYSSYKLEDFMKVLSANAVSALADVRSSPYSATYPDYNRENLQKQLKINGIAYVYLGDLLGARVNDPHMYVNNSANFSLIAKSFAFKSGITRLKEGTQKGYLIALMCAEKDPLTCHRTILICKNIRNDFDIKHILPNFRIESHDNLEKRLLRLFSLDGPDLFGTPEDIKLEQAYKRQENNIAYKASDQNTAEEE
jgi:uncharacterized protein (DUF488 family)